MSNNVSGNAYALTILSPIKDGYTHEEIAYADVVRDCLQSWNTEHNSPMALVPNTYLCRYFVLDDVVNQSLPGGGALDTLSDFLPMVPDTLRRRALPAQDQLQSRYLVFACTFHGDLDTYLRGMWKAIGARIGEVWKYCYGFEHVDSAEAFITYMKRCQLQASLFFVGSNDDALASQLKALYLKQELAKFAIDNQGLDAAIVRRNMHAFLERVDPSCKTDKASPTWAAGKYRLKEEATS